jgi:hypothetical protein
MNIGLYIFSDVPRFPQGNADSDISLPKNGSTANYRNFTGLVTSKEF